MHLSPSSATGRVVRSLRRSPGFVAIATLSMGIALGISTTIFALMDAMTHPEPPFHEVDQLVNVQFGMRFTTPPPASEIVRNVNQLEGVDRTAQLSWSFMEGVVVVGGRMARITSIARAGPGLFEVLGTRARLGRLFTPADHEQGNVAVVTDLVWRRDYKNAASLEGATVQVGDRLLPVVGVLPRGTDLSLKIDVFLPDAVSVQRLSGLVVRLKPGVTVAQFQPRIKALNERLTTAHAVGRDRGISANIGTLRPDPLLVRDFHRAMVGAAVCVLLIACANVAALSLARGMVRKRDYALRLALGARPAELAREVIAEVGVLALIGCVSGAFVTAWFVGLIGTAIPAEMQWQGFVQPQWSWRVFSLAFLTVLLSVGVAGGAPAWIAARTDPAGPLKEGGGGTTGRAGTRFRWLVMAELAIAMTLLMSTSLMVKSIRMMERYEFGYPVERLLSVGVQAPWRQDSTSLDDERARRQQGLGILRAVPGVEAVILQGQGGWCGSNAQVITADRGTMVHLLGTGARPGGCQVVGAGFFSTLQVPLVRGRDFAEGDLIGAGGAILDENAARGLFGSADPIGHTVKFGDTRSSAPWLRVIGVAKTHLLEFDRHPELGANTAPWIYVVAPEASWASRRGPVRGTKSLAFLVRTGPDVEGTTLRIQQAIASLTPARGGVGVIAHNASFQSQLRSEQFLALVFTLMGLASLMLGAAGLYSVISYVAGQRMREFAVRIALGATQRDVVTLVLREGFVMSIGGTAIGAGFGMWAAFLLWDRMWGVYPVDAQALVIAESVLILTTMAACLVPALRAARSDPLEVMRAA